jgi:hypothetical protein
MLNRTRIHKLALGCALLVPILSPSVLAGGPPWISVEMPGDPTNPSTRGAVMLVRAHSCGAPTSSAVIGTAHGIVAGGRRTIPLALEPAGAPGVYALRQQWPSEGTWVLLFTMSIGGQVSAIVTLGPNGGVERTEYKGNPSSTVCAASVQVLARQATAEDVEALLRAAATGEHLTLARATSGTALAYLAGGLGTAAIAMGAAVRGAFWRRRREAERV